MSDGFVVIGRVTRTHGVHGEVRVHPYTDEADSLKQYDRLYFQVPNEVRKIYRIDAFRPHKNLALLKINGVYGLEAAQRFLGADVLIKRDWMPPLEPDEYYWTDLVGLKIIDHEGRDLGVVKRLQSTGADDLLVFERDQEEYYLPFREEIIRSVDLDAGYISASPPPGLFEL
ncbi:MAG: 16S rRNA processing protein RimM [Deltaproteobacteria bacterium]|nr:16S rRNA processing protein RimM [Deltaproteobacteria bacterium]